MMLNRIGKKSPSTEFNKIISIQEVTKSPDSEGGFTKTWATISQPWAGIFPLNEKQIFDYRSIKVYATHLIKIRGGVTLTEFNRILFNSRVFEVLTSANIQERGIITRVMCKEIR